MKDHPQQNENFISALQRLCQDRGHAAALRRYWSDTTRYQSLPVLGRLGAIGDERMSTVAALYAVHPNHREGQGIGRAAYGLGKPSDVEHPYDRHFRRLLACDDLSDLAAQLHRLVKRLERDGIGLDYAGLLKDLNFWTSSKRPELKSKVKTDWAKDFWQAPNIETPAA